MALGKPWFNPEKSYDDNFAAGPEGEFGDGAVVDVSVSENYTFFGKPLAFPIGIPAGPLLNGAYVKAALDKGFDLPIHKTVRTRVYASHPWPNVLGVKIEGDLTLEKAQQPLLAKHEYSEPLSITNSFGNPSRDPSFWQKDIAEAVAHARTGQHVLGSWEGTKWEGTSSEDYIEDWVLGAKLLKETGVSAIEANLSCPNEGTANLLCFDAPKVATIADRVKNAVGDLPFIVKVAYFSEDALRDFVKTVGSIVDGIAAINTISAVVVDEKGNQALPGEKRVRSGICGAAIKWAGIDMARRLKLLREELHLKYTIIGVGGVTIPQDFFEYRKAGADIVMSATGAMWNGNLARE
ncbi:hypothetical protein A2841_00600, partial [Candidatus Kaiserbacteria bacterium RIFCSPHIGHO2_01_FULL_48_10]